MLTRKTATIDAAHFRFRGRLLVMACACALLAACGDDSPSASDLVAIGKVARQKQQRGEQIDQSERYATDIDIDKPIEFVECHEPPRFPAQPADVTFNECVFWVYPIGLDKYQDWRDEKGRLKLKSTFRKGGLPDDKDSTWMIDQANIIHPKDT